MKLTIDEQKALEEWLAMSSVGKMDVERPTAAPVGIPSMGAVAAPIGSKVRLSGATAKAEERMALRKARHKAAAAARAEKLPKGRFHHKRKEATWRRGALKRWKTQPYKCCVYGHGNWSISEEEWNTHLSDYWKLYPAEYLHIQRKWGKGTKEEPYLIWHLKLYYRKGKKELLLWDGSKEVWKHLSKPNELDIEKAHEGALLFTDESYAIHTLKVVWRGQKGIFIPMEHAKQ